MTREELRRAIAREVGADDPLVLTVMEFRRLLRVSRPTAYRMLRLPPERGGVRVVQTLTGKRIPVAEVYRLFGVGFGDGEQSNK